MALKKRTRPYEVLVRWHADGSVAAHAMMIEEIVEDGKVINSKDLPPVPIDIASSQFAEVAALFDEQAISNNGRLRLALETSQAANINLATSLKELALHKDGECAALHAEIKRLQPIPFVSAPLPNTNPEMP